ncbi:MAG: hypothetical protein NW220_21230 [Leptolyngbyaceae cyanobacterium bins.349]|nr:hypothetical protein [Leptolyngbyaceae cyanobacterium bins.349]
MSPHPEDDSPLTQFLKHHAPNVPAASADLEERLLTLIEQSPQATTSLPPVRRSRPRDRRPHGVWLLPTAIAAGLVAMVSYQTLLPPQPSEAELAELETFIESTWQGTLAEQPTTETEDLYPLTDDPTVN